VESEPLSLDELRATVRAFVAEEIDPHAEMRSF